MRKYLLFGLIGFLTAASVNGAVKVAAELQSPLLTGNIDVIVQFNQTPSAAQHQLVARYGGSLKKVLLSANAGQYVVPASAIAGLAAEGQVVYVSADRANYAMLDVAAAAVSANVAATYQVNGKGIGIAVIDSGVSPVADLASRIVYKESFVPGDSTAAVDQYGHGTHVSGIIAGSGASSAGVGFTRTFTGIAPGANILSLKVLDANGEGTDSAIIAAIDRIISLKQQYNIRVINLSVGRPVYESFAMDPLCHAVEKAWENGIVVVVAAGNYGRNNYVGNKGYGTITAPGNDPMVITVGAMKTQGTLSTSDDVIATYSGKGPTMGDRIVKPDLVAPGNQIVSAKAPGSTLAGIAADAVAYSEYKANGTSDASADYLRLSGTSMATPVVSAAAALLLQQNPNMTPDQVKATLMKTASKRFAPVTVYTDPNVNQTFVDHSDIFTVGAGYLNIGAALQSTDLATGHSFSPMAITSGGKIYLADSAPAIWTASSAWGDATASSDIWVWGGSSIWGSGAIWSGTAVWGNSVLASASPAAWGGNAIAGNSDIWVWGGNTTSASSDIWVWGGNTSASSDIWVWGGSTQASSDIWVWGGNTTASSDIWVWGGSTNASSDIWVWGGNALWGASDIWVWGGSTTNANSDIWVWGGNSVNSSSDIWVWGGNAVSSNSILTGEEK